MNRINTPYSNYSVRLFCLLLVISFCSGIYAQEKEKNVHICLKATPGIFWSSATSPAAGNGAKFGFGYGANVEIGLTETIYFITGLEVNAAGVKYKSTDSLAIPGNSNKETVTTAVNSSIQYLQIPLFFKMKTKEIGMLKYFGQFGLGSGIVISNNTTYTTTVTSGSTTLSENGTDSKIGDLNFLRESLLIGGGIEYNLSGSTSLLASLMYDNGFTTVLPSGNGPTGTPNHSIYSKGIALTIGILF